MSLLAFWCASICSLPFGWLVFFSLALKWLRARCGWGDPGVAWSRVLAKFYLQCAKFYAASTFHFHFFILILLPSSCTPAWSRHATLGSPPPFGRPSTEEATLVSWAYPSLLPPKSAPSLEQIAAQPVGRQSSLINTYSFIIFSQIYKICTFLPFFNP